MTPATEVLVTRQGLIATICINRPEAMNALNFSAREKLVDAVERLDADPEIRVLVLTGSGHRAFCAGLDLKELETRWDALPGRSRIADPVLAIERCTIPVIAAVNGVAITGGFELALACDVRLASATARFADTHARVGLLPVWGLSQRLSRIAGIGRAKELSLTGNFLDAQTALSWGLVNRILPPDALLAAAHGLAAEMAEIDATMLGDYKSLIDDGFALPLAEGLALEQERAVTANERVKGDAVASARLAVLARGRKQP